MVWSSFSEGMLVTRVPIIVGMKLFTTALAFGPNGAGISFWMFTATESKLMGRIVLFGNGSRITCPLTERWVVGSYISFWKMERPSGSLPMGLPIIAAEKSPWRYAAVGTVSRCVLVEVVSRYCSKLKKKN